jgi:hypothetical protein
MKQGADWLAWSLQFTAGFIVGRILALYITRRSLYRLPTASSQHVLMLVLGAALVGAGLASCFGDRLWLGSSYRVIPPDGVPHSRTSKALSVATTAIGGSLVLFATLLNLRVI